MSPLEQANARRIMQHYVLDDPDVATAILDEQWLASQNIGWLQVFEDAVRCLDTVLCRVLEGRYEAAR